MEICNNCKKTYKNKKSLAKHIKICIIKMEKRELDSQVIFELNSYLVSINKKIEKLFSQSKYSDDILDDILLNNFIKSNMEQIKLTKKIKQLQMNIGKIWQIVIGNYNNFIDLGEGDKTGLDVKSDKLKIIMEIKNRHNTDNASSKKTNLSKLAKFKKENPDYTCIYAVINDKTKEGKDDIIKHDEMEIRYLSGNSLLEFIFDADKDKILTNLEHQLKSLSL